MATFTSFLFLQKKKYLAKLLQKMCKHFAINFLLCKMFATFLQIWKLHIDFRPREESVSSIEITKKAWLQRSFCYRYCLHIVLAPKHSLVLVKNLKLWWQCTGACWACAFESIKLPFILNGVRRIIVQILLKFNHTLHSWKMVLECIKNITYQILCIRF